MCQRPEVSKQRHGTYGSDGGPVLPRIPTAKYPSKAKMKRMQQRISVQPLRRGEAERGWWGLVLQKENNSDQRLKTDISPVVNRPFEVWVKLPGLPWRWRQTTVLSMTPTGNLRLLPSIRWYYNTGVKASWPITSGLTSGTLLANH